MVINEFKYDLSKLCLEKRLKKKDLAAIVGKFPSYLNNITKIHIVNAEFARIIEVLGYDIEIVYHKR